MTSAQENNIRLYPWFQFATSIMAWLPVFFLYFNQFVSFSEVIQLGAIYYLSVCICEVPSGYFSDRAGRRVTLIAVGCSLAIGYLLFLAATSFAGLATGQCFVALGMAMMSGTDTAFLYDSLLSAGRESQYADHEARGQKYGFAASALSSLVGGVLGLVDLSLAYLVSLAGALCAIVIAWQFREPDVHAHQALAGDNLFKAIWQCLGQLGNGILAWLFAVMVLMYSLEHLVFEFYQPYIKLLEIHWIRGDSSTLIAGVVIAVSMFGGTLGAAYSVRLQQKFGLKALLLGAFAIQLVILTGISAMLSIFIIALVMLRNFPMAMIHAPVVAAIIPRVDSNVRATYLSIQSLAARLAFSSWLLLLSFSIDGGSLLGWSELSLVLRESLVFGIAAALVLSFIAPRGLDETGPKESV